MVDKEFIVADKLLIIAAKNPATIKPRKPSPYSRITNKM